MPSLPMPFLRGSFFSLIPCLFVPAFEYNHPDLGNYLIEKGADAGLVNAQGLTCYEGLSSDAVDAI